MRTEGLRFAVAALVACAFMVAAIAIGAPAQSGAAEDAAPPRVYVVVVDGMVPSEVDDKTPTLSALKARGTWYEQARAVYPAETLPNHAAMATGMLPSNNGIIANQWWSAPTGYSKQYMEHPGLLDADTIVTRLERACNATGGDIATATVMSKSYLVGIFRGEPPGPAPIPSDPPPNEPQADDPNPQREADFHWRPGPYIPVSNHVPDVQTMTAFRDWIAAQPADLPQFAFVNLGDVDRAGHADQAAGMSFGATRPFRQGAIEDTDAQLKLLVDGLETSEAWDRTALIVLSDHGMDYGPQNNEVAVAQTLASNGYTTADGVVSDANVVGGGGSGLVWVADPKNIEPMAEILADHPGVEFVSTRTGGLDPQEVPRQTTHAQIGFDHPRAPDIEVFTRPGWHVSDGGNPLPGNHAHYATQHSVLLVTGGHPAVRDVAQSIGGETVYDPGQKLFAPPAAGPGSLSIAPTVAALLGIGEPAGGYDGTPLTEARDPAE
ncbi:MAG TPA: alkaline phosphatase family protein, partial [Solirubrobacteraceae bacterium]|nr:alkaline phosphatase family protein [Solirubrobacteraceae bacterium]